MGAEYMLDFEVDNRREIDGLLRDISGFEGYDPRYSLYNFRRTSTGKMPDAHAKIEENGVYVCDNGASGCAVVQDIRAAVSALAPSYTFRDLCD
jgi:hypothetical protein